MIINYYNMKLYIDDYDPKDLINKLDKLKKYLINSYNYIEIYSDDGIYYIDKSQIYKIIVEKDESIKYTCVLSGYKFILDKSISSKELVNNIPLNHINNTIYKNEYIIDSKKDVIFIIEGYYEKNEEIHDNDCNVFIPNNFYFELSNNDNMNNISKIINNNSINVFLSLLK